MHCTGAIRQTGVWALAALAMLLCLPRATLAQDAPSVRTVGSVIDYAGILSPEQKRPLEIAAGQLARRIGTDMFVVTINDREAIWADQKSHYAMVERAFENIRQAIRDRFNREAPLTVLLVFKSSVVLHLKTSDKNLQDDLVYQNFYSKSVGALERIRRDGESYDAAALRYLGAFNATLDEIAQRAAHPGLLGQTERAHQWLVKTYAMPLSRNIVENPVLDPLYRLWCTAITYLATHAFLPGWIAFLLILAAIYIGMHVVAYLLERHYGRIGEMAGDALVTAGLVLPLFMLFAVSMPDLENLLVIAQRYASESSVLLTYLEWSSAIEAHSFKVPFATIVATAAVVALLELAHRGALLAETWKASRERRERLESAGDSEQSTVQRLAAALQLPGKALDLVMHVLSALGWVLSQVIWPGPIAAFFMVFSVARRLVDLAGDYQHFKSAPSVRENPFVYHQIVRSGGSS